MDRCCESDSPCVFSKALKERAAVCGLARRRWRGELECIECPSSQARGDCARLAALMHERARFALRLPPPGRVLMHQQAQRLQCGGLGGLRDALQAADVPGAPDVHAMVALGLARDPELVGLPWADIVAAMRAWVPRRRRPAG